MLLFNKEKRSVISGEKIEPESLQTQAIRHNVCKKQKDRYHNKKVGISRRLQTKMKEF